jgi:transcriptional regulator with XRE-family HTH domain
MADMIVGLGDRIRTLRKERGWTQQDLAMRLGLKRSALGAYEEGRAEPRLATAQMMATQFGLTLDGLLSEAATAGERRARGGELRVLAVPVDAASEQERVAVVPVKAAAGYLDGYGDPKWVGELRTLGLPLAEVVQDRSYRLFQIEGDSMLPVPSGSYILADFVEDWQSAGGLRPHIVVTRDQGIVFKRVENRLDEETQDFLLVSDNAEFPPMPVQPDDICEVWRARGYLAFAWPMPNPKPASTELHKLQGTLDEIQARLADLKR